MEEMENKDFIGSSLAQKFTFKPTLKYEHDCESCDNVNEVKNCEEHFQIPALKTEINKVRHDDNQELNVKIEEVDIKMERSNCESFPEESQETGLENKEAPRLMSTYKTKRQKHLDQNESICPGPLEETTYKCELCSFETRHKSNLKPHMLNHKDPAEITMYRCPICQYETRHKSVSKRHVLIHKNPLEVVMYKCASCKYETKFKDHLVQHMPIHRSSSEVTMYKCVMCKYETRYKVGLKRHMLKHKTA